MINTNTKIITNISTEISVTEVATTDNILAEVAIIDPLTEVAVTPSVNILAEIEEIEEIAEIAEVPIPYNNIKNIFDFFTLTNNILINNNINDDDGDGDDNYDISYRLMTPQEIIDKVLSESYITDDNDICSICYQSLHSTNVYKLNDCEHIFHKICLDKWIFSSYLKDNCYCPLCRHDIN